MRMRLGKGAPRAEREEAGRWTISWDWSALCGVWEGVAVVEMEVEVKVEVEMRKWRRRDEWMHGCMDARMDGKRGE